MNAKMNVGDIWEYGQEKKDYYICLGRLEQENKWILYKLDNLDEPYYYPDSSFQNAVIVKYINLVTRL